MLLDGFATKMQRHFIDVCCSSKGSINKELTSNSGTIIEHCYINTHVSLFASFMEDDLIEVKGRRKEGRRCVATGLQLWTLDLANGPQRRIFCFEMKGKNSYSNTESSFLFFCCIEFYRGYNVGCHKPSKQHRRETR